MGERTFLGELEHLILAAALRLGENAYGAALRGGRPKRFVTPTPQGVNALAEHREALLSIWDGLEARL